LNGKVEKDEENSKKQHLNFKNTFSWQTNARVRGRSGNRPRKVWELQRSTRPMPPEAVKGTPGKTRLNQEIGQSLHPDIR
jgi:hypothetical protein